MTNVAPDYSSVEGLPPAIKAKITQLVNAAHDAAFSGMADPVDRQAIDDYEIVSRYNLEQTIMTFLNKNTPNK